MTELKGILKRCTTCYGYGLYAVDGFTLMVRISMIKRELTIACPECGANPNPVGYAKRRKGHCGAKGSIKKGSTFQLFDGQVKDWREQGLTFQLISDKTGVSRQRIKQIVDQRYPEAKSLLPNEQSLAHSLGMISTGRLQRLRKSRITHPAHIGNSWHYSTQDIEIIKKILVCVICKKSLLPYKGQQKYCPECAAYVKTSKGHYAQYLEICKRANKKWRKNNPDKVKIINRKAYQAKKERDVQ